jgi:hypothetical protein
VTMNESLSSSGGRHGWDLCLQSLPMGFPTSSSSCRRMKKASRGENKEGHADLESGEECAI